MTSPRDLSALLRWSGAVAEALASARGEIDALNVFPVADSDTGTNVYLTVDAAAAALADVGSDGTFADGVRAYVDGALLGARGNSGVILAQLLRAGGRALLAGGADPRPDRQLVATVLERAAAAAYEAVGTPVEGTILTVASAAAAAARSAADRGDAVAAADAAYLDTTDDGAWVLVVEAAATGAREALLRTPEQLDRLRDAGVVDAGGRALVVLLDATVEVLTGRRASRSWRPSALPRPVAPSVEDAGPAYEVMYLLAAEDAALPALRAELERLGESLAVVGGEGLWNVHVHVDDVGAAIEAGIDAGRPRRIAVTRLADGPAGPGERRPRGRVVVATAAGPGIAAMLREAGAEVLQLERTDGLAVADLVRAVGTGADEVVLLANHRAYVAVCEATAVELRARGCRVAVIPSHTQVQGLSAMAVHDPGHGFDDDVVAMTSAAGHTHHGAITVAQEHGMTMAGPCRPGDVLGVVEGEFAVVGTDRAAVALQVVQRLSTNRTELVTIVAGSEADPGLVEGLEREVRRLRPDVDTVVYDGGQSRYDLLLGVE